ncbi:molecular chaperone TorD [Brevirhabdus pacifica]|uniref:Molecular chaperone TorD n=1 Tax=Brevirhabdus pacifica TaxID=1267768 RepID=A0A1U7DKE9_9RHOB|nr:molecular chaperone TorD family protein [Brevirhabdus pacifica]APX90497.1 molecular chaperone TorD [Brevirhabdus pacifica]OWU78489.1 molecular chaperone TorD [Loktanella sp. 22II-4b]PJJ85392.1 TorA maturation chaperone TorD [Brevirhabdus pacifica]
MAETAQEMIAEEDRLRADLYDFLGVLLATPPDKVLLQKTRALSGDDSELGQAVQSLARLAGATSPSVAEAEFNALFIGLGRGELLPYASYYLTGFLNEKPLAALRGDMGRLSIIRAPNVFEPEDNIASLFEMMAGLITGRFGAPAPVSVQKDFFNRHLGPWAGHFFTDLEGAKNSVFYAPVGAAGRAFIEIEKDAFRMTAD